MTTPILKELTMAGSTEKERPRCIVRLRTTRWSDTRGLHIKRSLTYLRRQCVGLNGLEEDTNVVGASETFTRITNLDQCADGVYEVVVCNVSRDWESGYVDDWRYKLLPI